MAGAGSPFRPTITVVRSTVPNAFALPGGKAFYFSALLEQTETPDEFAGVMAHELGHVVHRHVMEQLISSAGTGLLIGFILGDMTGLSVAGGLGAILIDTRFSREAEEQADRLCRRRCDASASTQPALADLLERVAGDDDFTRALALLSTHPLTRSAAGARSAQRRAVGAAAGASPPPSGRRSSTMCATTATGATPAKNAPPRPSAPVQPTPAPSPAPAETPAPADMPTPAPWPPPAPVGG